MALKINYESYRPTACAFYAGRIWYSGIASSEKLGWVMFSQVLDNIDKVGKCYQRNDPTSEALSDLLDNDGGVIQIPEAGSIVALHALGKGLFVFSTNGVWYIHGGDKGFSAVQYIVEKITSIGAIGADTIVPTEENIIYWSGSGIFAIVFDQTTGQPNAKNISDNSIKSFYNAIPIMNKLYAQGKYNSNSKIIKWAYSTEEVVSSIFNRFNYNRMLCLNLNLGPSFYIEDIANDTIKTPAFNVSKETNIYTSDEFVVSGEDSVVVGIDGVVAEIVAVNSSIKQFKYISLTPNGLYYKLHWSDMNNTRSDGTQFSDYYSYDNVGTEKQAYIITGYNMGENGPSRAKTISYITMFAKRTETNFDEDEQPYPQSSVKAQIKWDFTDNSYTGKWTDEYQWYRLQRPFFINGPAVFDDGYPLVITKNKVRGRGKAMQLKFSSEEGKDMKIVGWSTIFVENENV